MPKDIDVDIEELSTAYQEDKLSLRKLAEKFGCSHETVRKLLILSGVTLRGMGGSNRTRAKAYTPPKMPKQSGRPYKEHIDPKKVKELYEGGMKVTAISEIFKCSPETIYQRLKVAGAEKPTRISQGRPRLAREAYIKRNQHIYECWQYVTNDFGEIAQMFKIGPERVRQIVYNYKGQENE